MARLYVKNFADLMSGYDSAEIVNLLRGNVARTVKKNGDKLELRADGAPEMAVVTPESEIKYEPWFMDRGSMLCYADNFPGLELKLCCEFDFVRYPDGKEFEIYPASKAPEES